MERTSLPSFVVPLLVVTCAVAPLLWSRATDLLRRVNPLGPLGSVSLATAAPTEFLAWASDVDERTRTPRRGRRSRPERTRPVAVANPDPTVFEQHPNGPPTQVLPAPEVGDVVSSGEHPLFEQDPGDVLNVVVNVSFARQENGERAVRVLDRRGQLLLQLTAAQAHQLAVDLHQSADVVGGIRQAAGFET